ncbi:DUF2785 domain-containing protein [Lacticaseibacillus hegangensis]|uniref:DUF2785 domain-containing protein n=1 Tax=Lacticaseibacillus hegangensis TaxID=2486010 RepID=A0ABW4CYP0_9LACO|nr:DUF2785 domain-containing protein [Lacticaseibacillus hegangensis]
MQEALEQKLTQPDPLTFTDAEVAWLLAHVGDLDGHVRDELTFTLLARGLLAGGFTLAQKAQINRTVVAAKPILQGIDQPRNDQVFLRSFTALLGSLILRADAQTSFLSRDDRGLWFQWALEYLYREHDWRGYVQGRGWAHALAHGSDLLAAALAHPQFGHRRQEVVFGTLRAVMARIQRPVGDDEEERLANVLVCGLKAGALAEDRVAAFLAATDDAFWAQAEKDAGLAAGYRLSAWHRVVQTLYFLAPAMRDACQPLITRYFRETGYLDR